MQFLTDVIGSLQTEGVNRIHHPRRRHPWQRLLHEGISEGEHATETLKQALMAGVALQLHRSYGLSLTDGLSFVKGNDALWQTNPAPVFRHLICNAIKCSGGVRNSTGESVARRALRHAAQELLDNVATSILKTPPGKLLWKVLFSVAVVFIALWRCCAAIWQSCCRAKEVSFGSTGSETPSGEDPEKGDILAETQRAEASQKTEWWGVLPEWWHRREQSESDGLKRNGKAKRASIISVVFVALTVLAAFIEHSQDVMDDIVACTESVFDGRGTTNCTIPEYNRTKLRKLQQTSDNQCPAGQTAVSVIEHGQLRARHGIATWVGAITSMMSAMSSQTLVIGDEHGNGVRTLMLLTSTVVPFSFEVSDFVNDERAWSSSDYAQVSNDGNETATQGSGSWVGEEPEPEPKPEPMFKCVDEVSRYGDNGHGHSQKAGWTKELERALTGAAMTIGISAAAAHLPKYRRQESQAELTSDKATMTDWEDHIHSHTSDTMMQTDPEPTVSVKETQTGREPPEEPEPPEERAAIPRIAGGFKRDPDLDDAGKRAIAPQNIPYQSAEHYNMSVASGGMSPLAQLGQQAALEDRLGIDDVATQAFYQRQRRIQRALRRRMSVVSRLPHHTHIHIHNAQCILLHTAAWSLWFSTTPAACVCSMAPRTNVTIRSVH